MKTLVIGGATIDVITSIDPMDIECITMKNATNSFLMMEQGKKVEATRIENQIGGGGGNAAVAMARMGADVSCVLKLGNDLDADRILGRLNEEKIKTHFVKKDQVEQTGKSIIISSHDRNAGVFVHRGANTTLCMDDLGDYMFEGMELVYISTLSSQSADAFPKIVELAKKAGAFVACNPGIRQIKGRKKQLFDALKLVDLLAINKEEAAVLVEGLISVSQEKIKTNDELPELIAQGVGERNSYIPFTELAQKIHEIGCTNLLVTNGAEGAYLAQGNTVLFRPSVPCQVESTLGAGDAFNATLAYSLQSKQSVFSALNMAALNGASVAAHLDTQSGLMTQDALHKRSISMDSSRILSYSS